MKPYLKGAIQQEGSWSQQYKGQASGHELDPHPDFEGQSQIQGHHLGNQSGCHGSSSFYYTQTLATTEASLKGGAYVQVPLYVVTAAYQDRPRNEDARSRFVVAKQQEASASGAAFVHEDVHGSLKQEDGRLYYIYFYAIKFRKMI